MPTILENVRDERKEVKPNIWSTHTTVTEPHIIRMPRVTFFILVVESCDRFTNTVIFLMTIHEINSETNPKISNPTSDTSDISGTNMTLNFGYLRLNGKAVILGFTVVDFGLHNDSRVHKIEIS